MKCKIKNCKNNALVLYGSSWICGEHMVKIIEMEKQRKNKLLEELE